MQHKSDTVDIIFTTTERLMARDGLHHLSIHKIAKEAGISPGTIYIHFENKEALLTRLIENIFIRFETAMSQNFNLDDDPYHQYHRFWWNLWFEIQKCPETVLNFHQYRSLPGFCSLVQERTNNPNDPWNKFCEHAKAKGVLCDLPSQILFTISLDSAISLSVKTFYHNITYPKSVLEQVVQQTWQAIKK
ncbi:TetR/AcrR family transcriptional regulator [Gallibacterium melopsittaci]|uniref:TetR/AcrR family transcriptional regulator n=2 Tax=Gallibacterium TaxID=155493 RepID=A0ABV6GZD7_9PAST